MSLIQALESLKERLERTIKLVRLHEQLNSRNIESEEIQFTSNSYVETVPPRESSMNRIESAQRRRRKWTSTETQDFNDMQRKGESVQAIMSRFNLTRVQFREKEKNEKRKGRIDDGYVPLRERLGIDSKYFVSEEASESFSPREDNLAAESRKRFKPDVISGSAFGTKEPPANPLIDKRSVSPRQSTSSGLVLNPGQRQRKTWSRDQVTDLKAGFQRFGSKWERIRKEYKSLEQFTGLQLKDKHRATFGTRAFFLPP